MPRKRPAPPSTSAIVEANLPLLQDLADHERAEARKDDALGLKALRRKWPLGRPAFKLAVNDDGSIDAKAARRTCWACGAKDLPLQKAHVVAHVDGGSNDPGNYFRLCEWCHQEQPELAARAVQVRWLKDRDEHGYRDLLWKFELTHALSTVHKGEALVAFGRYLNEPVDDGVGHDRFEHLMMKAEGTTGTYRRLCARTQELCVQEYRRFLAEPEESRRRLRDEAKELQRRQQARAEKEQAEVEEARRRQRVGEEVSLCRRLLKADAGSDRDRLDVVVHRGYFTIRGTGVCGASGPGGSVTLDPGSDDVYTRWHEGLRQLAEQLEALWGWRPDRPLPRRKLAARARRYLEQDGVRDLLEHAPWAYPFHGSLTQGAISRAAARDVRYLEVLDRARARLREPGEDPP
jgi:hypothetical protein